jgi:hypothetical protein
MRFNFTLTMIISFVVLFFINLDKSFSQEFVGEDERIIITVDSLERIDSFPESLKQPDLPGQKTVYTPPREGNDFVFIHITVVEKIDLKVKTREYRLTKSQLVDDRGETHLAGQQQTSIAINPTYPFKKNGYILFEIPKDAIPVQMKYLYQFREEPPKPQEIIIGEMDINL